MEFWINILDLGLVIAIFAVSLHVVLGAAGQLSIAPQGFGGVGAYLAGYMSVVHGVSLLPALAIGTVAAGLTGLVLGLPALRLSADYVILLTLAFATVMVALFQVIPGFGGSVGLVGVGPGDFFGPLLTPMDWLPVIALFAVGCLLFCWRMSASPFGRVLRGIREDPDAVQAIGKNVVSYKVTTFAWTAAVQGLGGVLLAYYMEIVSPAQFGFGVLLTMLAGVVVGGMGSLMGCFLGALALTALGPVLQKTVALAPERATLWQNIIYGCLLILVMRLRPAGLIPEGTSLAGSLDRLTVWLRIPRAHVLAPALPGTASAPLAGDERSHEAAVAPAAAETEAHGVTAHAPPRPVHLHGANGRPAVACGEPVVVATDIAKSFGGIHAVAGLDLHLASGKITALVGPNGAGKTTVFNLLTGRIRPDRGRVVLRGTDITGLPPHRVARLGMVRSFQDVRTLTRLTLLANVILGVPGNPGEHMLPLFTRPLAVRRGERSARAVALECLEFVGLEERAQELAGGLGYGDQKLLAVARILATGADVLLVDEPASGIDRGNLEPVLVVLERLRDEGKTICLVEHNLDVVTRLADHVFFMEEGRVSAAGTMEEIRQQERLAEVYFGHARTTH